MFRESSPPTHSFLHGMRSSRCSDAKGSPSQSPVVRSLAHAIWNAVSPVDTYTLPPSSVAEQVLSPKGPQVAGKRTFPKRCADGPIAPVKCACAGSPPVAFQEPGGPGEAARASGAETQLRGFSCHPARRLQLQRALPLLGSLPGHCCSPGHHQGLFFEINVCIYMN